MTSSRYHKQCQAHIAIAKGKIAQLQFNDAAIEILRADGFAIHAGDMFWVEKMRRELIDEHGVDWRKVKQDFTP